MNRQIASAAGAWLFGAPGEEIGRAEDVARPLCGWGRVCEFAFLNRVLNRDVARQERGAAECPHRGADGAAVPLKSQSAQGKISLFFLLRAFADAFSQVAHKNKKGKKKNLVRKKGFDTAKAKQRSSSSRPQKRAVKMDKRDQVSQCRCRVPC
jgi:hypothetical protein